MKDLKNILNYFGEYWIMQRCEDYYSFGFNDSLNNYTILHAKTPEALWKKIVKEIEKPIKGYKKYKRKTVKLKELHDPKNTVYVPLATREGKLPQEDSYDEFYEATKHISRAKFPVWKPKKVKNPVLNKNLPNGPRIVKMNKEEAKKIFRTPVKNTLYFPPVKESELTITDFMVDTPKKTKSIKLKKPIKISQKNKSLIEKFLYVKIKGKK